MLVSLPKDSDVLGQGGLPLGIWSRKSATDESNMQPGLRPAGLKFPIICRRRKGHRGDSSLLAEAGLAAGALALPSRSLSHWGGCDMGAVSTASF